MPDPDRNAHLAFGENSVDAARCKRENVFFSKIEFRKINNTGTRTRLNCESVDSKEVTGAYIHSCFIIKEKSRMFNQISKDNT